MKLGMTAGVGEQRRLRHGLIGLVPLVLGVMLATSGPAAAGGGGGHAPLSCGDVITKSTKLTHDIGPCPGNGLVVRSKNVSLNLAGHTVSAANGPEETIGILLDDAHSATVRNGTVTGFDAGLAVNGGSGNTVRGINARDNINDNIPSDVPENVCTYGDGITLTGSDNNRIVNNNVVHNGPYSGISLVEDSDHNVVSNNRVADSNVPNYAAGTTETGNCGTCGTSVGCRSIQDIGIRVEGPGASNNRVKGNRVTNSAIGGITIHGYVYCPPTPTGECGGPSQEQNTANLVQRNYVADTGKETYTLDPLADGIALLRQGPATVVGVSQGNTIERNTVVRSYRDGIYLGNPECGVVSGTTPPVTRCQPGPYAGNTVRKNRISNSRANGIFVPLGSVNNRLVGNVARGNATFAGTPTTPEGTSVYPAYDGKDGNPDCDDNAWHRNRFGTVNQDCVRAH